MQMLFAAMLSAPSMAAYPWLNDLADALTCSASSPKYAEAIGGSAFDAQITSVWVSDNTQIAIGAKRTRDDGFEEAFVYTVDSQLCLTTDIFVFPEWASTNAVSFVSDGEYVASIVATGRDLQGKESVAVISNLNPSKGLQTLITSDSTISDEASFVTKSGSAVITASDSKLRQYDVSGSTGAELNLSAVQAVVVEDTVSVAHVSATDIVVRRLNTADLTQISAFSLGNTYTAGTGTLNVRLAVEGGSYFTCSHELSTAAANKIYFQRVKDGAVTSYSAEGDFQCVSVGGKHPSTGKPFFVLVASDMSVKVVEADFGTGTFTAILASTVALSDTAIGTLELDTSHHVLTKSAELGSSELRLLMRGSSGSTFESQTLSYPVSFAAELVSLCAMQDDSTSFVATAETSTVTFTDGIEAISTQSLSYTVDSAPTNFLEWLDFAGVVTQASSLQTTYANKAQWTQDVCSQSTQERQILACLNYEDQDSALCDPDNAFVYTQWSTEASTEVCYPREFSGYLGNLNTDYFTVVASETLSVSSSQVSFARPSLPFSGSSRILPYQKNLSPSWPTGAATPLFQAIALSTTVYGRAVGLGQTIMIATNVVGPVSLLGTSCSHPLCHFISFDPLRRAFIVNGEVTGNPDLSVVDNYIFSAYLTQADGDALYAVSLFLKVKKVAVDSVEIAIEDPWPTYYVKNRLFWILNPPSADQIAEDPEYYALEEEAQEREEGEVLDLDPWAIEREILDQIVTGYPPKWTDQTLRASYAWALENTFEELKDALEISVGATGEITLTLSEGVTFPPYMMEEPTESARRLQDTATLTAEESFKMDIRKVMKAEYRAQAEALANYLITNKAAVHAQIVGLLEAEKAAPSVDYEVLFSGMLNEPCPEGDYQYDPVLRSCVPFEDSIELPEEIDPRLKQPRLEIYFGPLEELLTISVASSDREEVATVSAWHLVAINETNAVVQLNLVQPHAIGPESTLSLAIGDSQAVSKAMVKQVAAQVYAHIAVEVLYYFKICVAVASVVWYLMGNWLKEDMLPIWLMLGFLQMAGHLPLIGLYSSATFVEGSRTFAALGGLDIDRYDLREAISMIVRDTIEDYPESSALRYRARLALSEMGYQDTSPSQMAGTVGLCLLLITLSLVLMGLLRLIKFKNWAACIQRNVVWNITLRLIMTGFLPLLISSLFSIVPFANDPASAWQENDFLPTRIELAFGCLFALLLLFMLLWTPIFLYIERPKFDEKAFKATYGTLTLQLDKPRYILAPKRNKQIRLIGDKDKRNRVIFAPKVFSILLPSVFMLRRIGFVAIVFLPSDAYSEGLRYLSLIALNLAVQSFVLFVQPRKHGLSRVDLGFETVLCWLTAMTLGLMDASLSTQANEIVSLVVLLIPVCWVACNVARLACIALAKTRLKMRYRRYLRTRPDFMDTKKNMRELILLQERLADLNRMKEGKEPSSSEEVESSQPDQLRVVPADQLRVVPADQLAQIEEVKVEESFLDEESVQDRTMMVQQTDPSMVMQTLPDRETNPADYKASQEPPQSADLLKASETTLSGKQAAPQIQRISVLDGEGLTKVADLVAGPAAEGRDDGNDDDEKNPYKLNLPEINPAKRLREPPLVTEEGEQVTEELIEPEMAAGAEEAYPKSKVGDSELEIFQSNGVLNIVRTKINLTRTHSEEVTEDQQSRMPSKSTRVTGQKQMGSKNKTWSQDLMQRRKLEEEQKEEDKTAFARQMTMIPKRQAASVKDSSSEGEYSLNLSGEEGRRKQTKSNK